MPVTYATVEELREALDVRPSARLDRRLGRTLASASRSVEGLLHRVFYPTVATRYFDWPPETQRSRSWRLWLDADELVSVTTLTSGGTTITSSDYLLEPDTGPPFTNVQINVGSDASFESDDTWQRAISIAGVFGYRDDGTDVGATVEALDASETGVDVDGPTAAEVGVGDLLTVDSERVIVTGRTSLDTGQNIGADLAAVNSADAVTVSDGTAFAAGEVVIVDTERMLIVEVVGNTLSVDRAVHGTTLAAHTTGADIYALRTLTVSRGAFGTTAATHSSGATVTRFDPPPLVKQLTLATAIVTLQNEGAGFARQAGEGEMAWELGSGSTMKDLRAQAISQHGRRLRHRSS